MKSIGYVFEPFCACLDAIVRLDIKCLTYGYSGATMHKQTKE